MYRNKLRKINESTIEDMDNDILSQLNSREYDTPKPKNKAEDIVLPLDFIDKIIGEKLTYEDIDNVSKIVPIFKYKNQLTIHGNLPNEQLIKIKKIAYIILNKNGSIGIPYTHIDRIKKENLKYRLRKYKIPYNIEHKAFRYTGFDLEKVEEFYNRINTDDFLGNKKIRKERTYRTSVGKSDIFHAYIRIDMFPLDNMKKIIESFIGMTIEEYENIENKENELKKQKLEEDRLKREEAYRNKLNNKKREDEIKFGGKFTDVNVDNIKEGDYIYAVLIDKNGKFNHSLHKYNGKINNEYKMTYLYSGEREYKKGDNFITQYRKSIFLNHLLTIFHDNHPYKIIRNGEIIFDGSPKKDNNIENINTEEIEKPKIVKYTDKSIAVFGNTSKYDDLLSRHGKKNDYLKWDNKIQSGWIFPSFKEHIIKNIINE